MWQKAPLNICAPTGHIKRLRLVLSNLDLTHVRGTHVLRQTTYHVGASCVGFPALLKAAEDMDGELLKKAANLTSYILSC